MDIIDLRETRDLRVLTRAYEELYLSCFTDPDEQEDLEQYRERLFCSQKPIPQPVTHFLVAGEKLADPDNAVIYGLQIFELYRESACGLLTYIAVSPLARGKGLGRLLLRRAIEILSQECTGPEGLRAVFAETHDPAQIDPAEDAMSPRDRIEVMKRLGAQLVPVRYVQPELRPGDGRSRKLLLITFGVDADKPPVVAGKTITDFMHEFYRALGVINPDVDPDYLQIQADTTLAVAGRPSESIVAISKALKMEMVRTT